MKALIKNGLVIDPKRDIKDKLDILIENSNIINIKKNISDEAKYVIDAKGMIVAPGFVDLHANFCDPGATDREDLKTGSLAAAKGGYTHVILGTDNKPAPSESNVIDYINKYSNIMPINIFSSAAVTVDRSGFEISDISFLHNHGALAYFDGLKPINDKNLLGKIMKAIKAFDGVLSIYCESNSDSNVRGIAEGNIAKKLNIKNPTPCDSECNDMEENIKLAKLYGVKLDIAYVSSSNSIAMLEKLRKEYDNIFVEVPALNLILNEKAMDKKGTLAKVLPPLRTESDRIALCKALKKGLIDSISSNHVPIEADEKNVKFKDANCGSIGLETVLGICGVALVDEGYLSWKDVIEKLSTNPARLYSLDKDGAGTLEVGKKANITIFDPNEKWQYTEESIVSKSHNTPLIGLELKGKVKYNICNGKLVYRDVNIKE